MSRRRLLTLLAAAAALSAPGNALASGDSCDPGWGLDFAAKPRCSNIPALVPGNDSRANLMLLLSDRRGAPVPSAPALQPALDWPGFRDRFEGGQGAGPVTDYAEGEGSRCRSNDGGERGFSEAVAAAPGLSPGERTALTQARVALKPSCAGAPAPDPASAAAGITGVASPAGRAYADYLRAAAAFYAGRFDEAGPAFAKLEASSDPWLSDTASYMVARTAVNRMQVDAFDQYGTFKGAAAVDQTLADAAAARLDAYVGAHPKGRYVASAEGLGRRVAWLAGRTERLAARYGAIIAAPPERRTLTDAALAEEIDNKLQPALTPETAHDPILLAVTDLLALRKADDGDPQPPRPDLDAQREALAAIPGLHGYLVAASAFYADGDAKAVLAGIPDDARRRGGDHLWFSRQFLRGLALEASGDRNARGFWKELIPAAARPLDRAVAELALAIDDERRGDVEDAFAPGSPVANPAIRTKLLVHAAGPALLRARASDPKATDRERQVSLYTLLRKELTHGAYAGFLSDLPRVPPGSDKDGPVTVDPLGESAVPLGLFVRGETAGEIGCPALADTAAALNRDPGAARPGLCLGEWMRLNGFDPDRYVEPPAKGALGTGPSAFPGKPVTRSAIYAAVIADRAAPAEDRAYALYRAVKCYEPSGSNACGVGEAPKAERRRWHDALKREYPGSRWARELRYWW